MIGSVLDLDSVVMSDDSQNTEIANLMKFPLAVVLDAKALVGHDMLVQSHANIL